MIGDRFRSSQPIGDSIAETMRKLKLQSVKLDQVVFRLHHRDNILVQSCAAAIKKNSKERAAICANEVVEVRKLINIVTQSQLAIERIVLRLETLKELHDVIIDLKPALALLRETTVGLGKIVPDVALELEKVNESVSETLTMTKMSSPQPITPFETKASMAGEEVLKEVSEYLEDRLSEELPQPPTSILMKQTTQPIQEMRQMVALAADCPEVEVQRECETEKPGSYRPLEIQTINFAKSQPLPQEETSPLEDIVLDYAKRYKGMVEVTQCADELNVQPEEVSRALKNLGSKGKIQLRKW